MNCAILRMACAVLLAASCTATPDQSAAAQTNSRPLTLQQALARALTANPRLDAAAQDIGIADGRRIQAGAIPNPEASFELDNALGSGIYRGTRSAETTLQLSQLIELGGKRQAREAAGLAETDSAIWQREAERLELLSDTSVAFVTVLAAQRRVQIIDEQVAALDRLGPQLQRRVEAGASSPAEISRAQVATDLLRVEGLRARTALATARRDLAVLMGSTSPTFASVTGQFANIGRPPSFQSVLSSIDSNPQLVRWTAVRAQREAELLAARLKPIPDVQLSAGWRHYNDTNDNAVRLTMSVPLPIWDQNKGDIIAANESLRKVEAERGINKAALIGVAGRAYDAATGAQAELNLLRSSVIPTSRKAAEAVVEGYGQGRFSLLDLLDAQGAVAQAALREQEALQTFHIAVTTIEGLVGRPFVLTRERAK